MKCQKYRYAYTEKLMYVGGGGGVYRVYKKNYQIQKKLILLSFEITDYIRYIIQFTLLKSSILQYKYRNSK